MSDPRADESGLGRATLARVSWRILPLLGIGYAIAYMDRVNISFAAARMNADLHFSAAVYGLGGGLFFLSYALFEVPSNMLLTRFGARRWIARIMLTWGVLAIAMMFVRTPIQFYAARFLLGLAEAGFFPGVIYYLGLWFPASHRCQAISRFYIAWPLSTAVMGAVAGGLLDLHGRLGLAGWQWLFLVEGAPAIVMSAVVLFLLPDGPASAGWLSPEQKGWIERRLAADAVARGDETHGFLRALTNPLVLILGAVHFLCLGAFYAFALSAPIVLDSLTHLGATRVGYVIAGAGVAGAAAMLLNGWRSDRARERYLHLVVPLLIAAGAYAVLLGAGQPAVVIAAFVVSAAAVQAYNAVIWSLPAELLPARSAAVSVAAINSIGQLGSFCAAFAWGVARDRTGGFRLGIAALIVAYALAAGVILWLGWSRRRVTVRAAIEAT